MLDKPENQELQEKLKELEEYVFNIKNVKEWKRGEAVRLRLLDKSYEEIQKRLGVSISFIAKSQKKYLDKGIPGLKLGYQGSKSYLTPSQLEEIEQWLIPLERRNISELERHLIEEYDVVFKSPESYYKILRDSQANVQEKELGLFMIHLLMYDIPLMAKSYVQSLTKEGFRFVGIL